MIKQICKISLLSTFFFYAQEKNTPLITLIFVIDQCAYHYTTQLKKNFQYGIHSMLTEGKVFTNAHHPHGAPATCTGHTALNTGAYADTHGIPGNAWYHNGTKVACDDDITNTALILNPRGGHYTKSKSSRAILVDGISDQFTLNNTPENPHAAYSFGIKSRAAIATANKLGTPFWFDDLTGMFTTSVAYVTELPTWLTQFNAQNQVTKPVVWNQKYTSETAYPYGEGSYAFIGPQKPLINSTIPLELDTKHPYNLYLMTPAANQLVVDCSKACIDNFFNTHKSGNLLVWICLGSLDKLGHVFGPRSKEIWDMLYWLDAQIEECVKHAEKYVGEDSVLTVFTSDHGTPPIPEEAHALGLTSSVRVDVKQLIKELNDCIALEYGIEKAVKDIRNNTVYLEHTPSSLSVELKKQILKSIQKQLMTCPHIARVWLPEELQQNNDKTTIPYRFKRQFFTGRSGDLIIEARPFVHLSTKKFGAGHISPYTYNTHVPLILRWPGHLSQETIPHKVTTTQLAPTLAQLLQIPQPAGAEDDILPGILK